MPIPAPQFAKNTVGFGNEGKAFFFSVASTACCRRIFRPWRSAYYMFPSVTFTEGARGNSNRRRKR